MAIDWTTVKSDIKHAASGFGSAAHLTDIYCGNRKSSRWVMAGQCLYCSGNILYRVFAIFQNGSIIQHSHDLNGVACPHCKVVLGQTSVSHGGVHSHES